MGRRDVFKSHLHNGQRVASVYTIRPKTGHFAFGQIFMSVTCKAISAEFVTSFKQPSEDFRQRSMNVLAGHLSF
jgi:hypothetical protein